MPEVGTIRKSSKPLKKNLTKMVIPPTKEPGKVVYGSLFPVWVAQTGNEPVAISVETEIPSDWKCDDCETDAEHFSPCEHHTSLCEDCCDCCWWCQSCEVKKNGDNEGSCSNCENCDNCCSCKTCQCCGYTANADYFCGQCGYCESDCECNSCEEDEPCQCGDCNPSYGSCGKDDCQCGGTKYGDRERPLRWGEEVQVRHHRQVDFSRFAAVEPAQAMADFYLLSLMEHGDAMSPSDRERCANVEYQTAFSAFIDTVKAEKAALTEKLDSTFRYYVDIAVGGEVRHHAAIRHATGMSADRSSAWHEWLTIREQVGPEALLEAADLFNEMHGGTYGGSRWALAAKVLYDRETGVLPPWAFVDRVFTMQHNGGSLLNKVQWKPYVGGLHGMNFEIIKVVGDAHAAIETDLIVLQLVASPKVNYLFRQWWTMRNKVFYSCGQSPLVFVRWQDRVIHNDWDYTCKNVLTLAGPKRLAHHFAKQIAPKPKPKPDLSPKEQYIKAHVEWDKAVPAFVNASTITNFSNTAVYYNSIAEEKWHD